MDTSLRDEISDFVQTNREAQLGFLTDLCNQNSYTYNAPGTDRVAEMVLEQIAGLLPRHELTGQTEVGSHHVLRSRTACAGSPAGSTYLLGHLDTVFPPDHPFQRCTLEGDWLKGPGTGDMKGGLTVIVYALKVLAHLGLTDRLNLTLILGADEEIGSAKSRSLYELETANASVCLAAECAGLRGEVVISRNGKAGARLECFGKDSHVAAAGEKKSSAILEIAGKIVALEALNGTLPGVSVNVGRIEGGLGPATVPGHASCLLDFRWPREEYYEILLEKAKHIIQEREQSDCRCELTILNHRPAMPVTMETEKLLRTLTHTAEALGMSLVAEHRRGSSDANLFGASGVPTVDGFGPICVGDHTPDERILTSSLLERTVLLASFLVHQSGSAPEN